MYSQQYQSVQNFNRNAPLNLGRPNNDRNYLMNHQLHPNVPIRDWMNSLNQLQQNMQSHPSSLTQNSMNSLNQLQQNMPNSLNQNFLSLQCQGDPYNALKYQQESKPPSGADSLRTYIKDIIDKKFEGFEASVIERLKCLEKEIKENTKDVGIEVAVIDNFKCLEEEIKGVKLLIEEVKQNNNEVNSNMRITRSKSSKH